MLKKYGLCLNKNKMLGKIINRLSEVWCSRYYITKTHHSIIDFTKPIDITILAISSTNG